MSLAGSMKTFPGSTANRSRALTNQLCHLNLPGSKLCDYKCIFIRCFLPGIRAVLDCQQLKELEDFPGSPRSELLVPAQFQTLPNPTEAYLSGGIQLESLTVDKLEEYQSYVFVVRVSNSQEGGPESNTTVCNRTQEAGMYNHFCHV